MCGRLRGMLGIGQDVLRGCVNVGVGCINWSGCAAWLRERLREMPALFWMFRFQNIRIPKYSAFTCWYRTDGRFVRLRLKPALGLHPLSLRQNAKGF